MSHLTLPQEDIYYEQMLYPNTPIYNIGAKVEIHGSLDIEIFKRACQALIYQHDACRIQIVKNEGLPALYIINSNSLDYFEFQDYSKKNIKDIESIVQSLFVKKFDFHDTGKLLFRFYLIKVEEKLHYFVACYHHIIIDGWGTSLLYQQLVRNYNELYESGEISPQTSFSYLDYLKESQEYKKSKEYQIDKEYWVNKLNVNSETIFHKNSLDHSLKSGRKSLVLPNDFYRRLNVVAENYKCSSFHVLLGALYVYLSRISGCKDINIGVPILNRRNFQQKKTVGLFMGMSILKVSVETELSFKDLIITIKNTLKSDYRHQKFPIGKLFQELNLVNNTDNILSVSLSYQKQNFSGNFINTRTNIIPLTNQSERLALSIYVREFDSNNDVNIDFDYNCNYFEDSDSISDLIEHYYNILNDAISTPHKKIKDISLLSYLEREEILYDFNNTHYAYCKEQTIVDLIYEKSIQCSNKTAINDGIHEISYSQLEESTNKIANFIMDLSDDGNQPIIVLMNRKIELIEVLIGILKAGKFYIPIDPTLPKDRIKYIISNSGSNFIIKDADIDLSNTDGIISINFINDITLKYDKNHIDRSVSLGIAYTIYTSGSTGNPKGVSISHKSLLNFLISMIKEPGISSNDFFFSVTTFSFDISILEFFGPLIAGATLILANNELLDNIFDLKHEIERQKITIIQGTPSFFQILINIGWIGSKDIKILCGGDSLSESLAKKMLCISSELWNMYGPTETTIWSTIKRINDEKESSIIGKPINNTQIYILDDQLNILPKLAKGNIYIGGDGLAVSYHNNEALTNEKFINNPHTGDLMYETGDTGLWLRSGEILFLGRNDNQVKIRGYRIELGEIESHINNIVGIDNCTVVARKETNRETIITAFLPIKGKIKIDESHLKNKLKELMPQYMIPNQFILVDKLPFTPNNKIDRKQLSDYRIEEEVIEVIAPQTEDEKYLMSVWQKVLKTTHKFGIQSDFFSLGGNSILAVELISNIKEHYSIEMFMRDVFENPTIVEQIEYVKNQKTIKLPRIKKEEPRELYDLPPVLKNIWTECQKDRMAMAYNMFALYSIDGNLNVNKLEKSFIKIINSHDSLRMSFIECIGNLSFIVKDEISQADEIFNIINLNDEEECKSFIDSSISRGFNLESEFLFKVFVLRISNDMKYMLFLTTHLVVDGWSLKILLDELIYTYNSEDYIADKHNIEYTDYSIWLNHKLNLDGNENSLENHYFKNFQLPKYFDGKKNIKYNEGRKVNYDIPYSIYNSISKFARESNLTIFSVLFNAFNILLWKLFGRSENLLATVQLGRNTPETLKIVGMLAKTIPVICKIDIGHSFLENLKACMANLTEISANEDIRNDIIVRFFPEILIAFQNKEFSLPNNVILDDANLKYEKIRKSYPRFPLSINFVESDNSLSCEIDFNILYLSQNEIEYIWHNYITVLESVLNKPNEIIENLFISVNDNINIDFDF